MRICVICEICGFIITAMRETMGYFVCFLILCWLSLGSALSATAQDENFPGEEAEITDVLAKEKKALSLKEAALKAKEAQLKIIEQDILEKIQELKKIKEDLAKAASLKKVEGPGREEELTRLAKVYEATPPEKAAQLLEQLDINLAAKILMRIDPRKAGKIWGYVEPLQGAKISTELGKEVKLYGDRKGSRD